MDAAAELGPRGQDELCAPRVHVAFDHGNPLPTHRLDERRSVEAMGPSHQWVLDRASSSARLVGPPIEPSLLAHPALGPVAIAFNRWAGRESFHASSFVVGGCAFGVVGARMAGKSSLMAGLAAAAVPVLSDDLVITDGRDAFSGPRCVDLRTPVPDLELAMVSARLGTRLRLALPPVPFKVPLGGWVFLRWGDEVSVEPCPPAETLSRLAQWRGRRGLVTDPRVLLDIAARPAWELTRPRSWGAFEAVRHQLVAAVAGLQASAA